MPGRPLALLLLATLVASAAAAAPPQYSFLGCFADTYSRALMLIRSDAAMTIPMCATLAAAKDYSIFGLQVGAHA